MQHSERGPALRAAAGAHAPLRRRRVGAEVVPGRGVHFRVWAPERRRVAVVIDARGDARTPAIELAREADGFWLGWGASLPAGARYGFKLDDEERVYPDPASRFQPDGPHGRSEVIDPSAFAWTDSGWPGAELRGQVIYELHLGTFTPEGTWAAARARLPQLRELGVTLIELMPVSDFPRDFGWGYDGVNLFAPTRLYGRPDDLRAFVDAAHGLGLGVILDVVYNHLGPDCNYLRCFAPAYFSERATEWGDAINFDGPSCGPVRDYFAENAAYWIDEFHLDGLRLDATQSLFDDSDEHILVAIARAARHPVARPASRGVRRLSREPRSGRKLRPR